MERIFVILYAVSMAAAFYGWCVWILKNEWAVEYVRRNWWLSPNAICYWRTGIAWLATGLYFWLGLESAGIIIFTFAAMLDGVDGLVARKCDLASEWGEWLDPLCDKLTYLPPLFGFAYLGIISMGLFWVLVAVEAFGQFFARKILSQLGFSVAANNFGKIKAVVCFALVIYAALLHANPMRFQFGDNILIICIILGIASIAFKFIANRFYADILSGLNFCCGIISLYLTSQNYFVWSIIAIMAGQFFDLFDGRMAEKHGGTRLGPFLDDIADFLSFGICPAYILIKLGGDFSWILAFFFVFGVAYRLIRFITIDKKRTDLPAGIFNGLPSPAGAIIVLGICLVFENAFIIWSTTLFSIALMVSHVNFAHFGRIMLKEMPKPLFILTSAAVLLWIAYIGRARDAQMFGWLLLSAISLYMVIGKMMATQIKNKFANN